MKTYEIIVTEQTSYFVQAKSAEQAEGLVCSAWSDGTLNSSMTITRGNTDVQFEQCGGI